RQRFRASWLELEHKVGTFDDIAARPCEVPCGLEVSSDELDSRLVESDGALRVRLCVLHVYLAVHLDDGASNRDARRFRIEPEVVPLQSAHLTASTPGRGKDAEHERVLRIA